MMAIVLLAIGFAANACAQFQAPMRPLLETYCQRCHGTTVQTAGINFTAASPSNRLLLKKMLRVLQDREMPAAAPLPTAEEREKMIAWVAEELKRNVDAVPKSAGHVTLPRLNRIEYNNTIRDLTGLDLRPADSFPVDPPGESGFNNDRYGLFLSPLLIEKYMDAAGFIAGELIAARANTKPFALKLEVEDMRITEMQTPKKPYGYDVGAPQNTIYEYVKFPRSGTYTFHVRAWGRQG
ncbi:MAG: DUF1587 domain-containing protein, partial [Candidatus Solibacter usitatus]|nr:DUF1587 domain-containing protein [Candidatus Solibacter usitatus]